MSYILAHDIGTSGTKTSLVDVNGRIVCSVTTPNETTSRKPGWAEQDPAAWWRGACSNTRRLIRQVPDAGKDVAVIGVSGHMLNCLALDAGGEPLCPSMIHSDVRASDACRSIAETLGEAKVYATTGNRLDPRSPLCKMLWLKREEPAIYRKTRRFVQSKDYLVGRMTGAWDTTDLSDASHAQWMDLSAGKYAVDMLGALGLSVDKLPSRLLRGIDLAGSLSGSAARELGLKSGIPVAVGGGDGACATVGSGCVLPGEAYSCIGTTAWVSVTRKTPLFDSRRRVFNIMMLDGKHTGVFGTTQCAGRAVEWAMKLVGESDFRRFDRLLRSADAGNPGLIFLPYLEGERSPVFDADARGVLFGLRTSHRREHVLRSVIEGVSFALRDVVDILRTAGEIRVLRLIGGGGRSSVWQQILSDICDVEIHLLSTAAAEATSLGAALAAGTAVGLFPDLPAAVRGVAVEEHRVPDPAKKRVYDVAFGLYRRIYPAVQALYKPLKELELAAEVAPAAKPHGGGRRKKGVKHG
jgi:xylulokinase